MRRHREALSAMARLHRARSDPCFLALPENVWVLEIGARVDLLHEPLGPYRILNIEYPTGNIELPTTTSIFLVQYSIFDIQASY